MQDVVVFALSEEYQDFSGGTVSLLDGEAYDVGEALDAGDGRIVLGPSPRQDEDNQVSDLEGRRAFMDARVVDVLDNYIALERVEVADDDEPASYGEVDITLTSSASKTELQERAKALDIQKYSRMSKDELAEAIASAEAAAVAAPNAEVVTSDPPATTSEGSSSDAETSTEGSGD